MILSDAGIQEALESKALEIDPLRWKTNTQLPP